MKFSHNESDCKIPLVGEIISLAIDERRYSPQGILILLSPISPAELLYLRGRPGRVLGMPTHFAQIMPGMIGLWPTPDRDYEATMRFFPPVETI